MFPHIAPPTPSTPKSLRPLGPGDFNFIRQIGQGAFGTVYLAQRSTSCSQSPREGRIVAIKACSKRELMSKSEESSRRKIAQLLDERNILESLDHPFVIKLYFFFQDSDRLYFGMTLAESGDFFAMITKENNGNGLDFHAARFYAAEIALALDYIHEKEVIYRDLKPENLLLCGDGHVMLADFGLSKRTKSSGRHGSTSTVGTPAYFAPELVMSEQYSKSVDWWAYGVVVFELLCGKEPFKGQNIKETMKNVVSKTPKLPPSVAKNLIASNSKESVTNVQNFIDRLLTKNGDDRLGALGGEEVKSHAYFKGAITHSSRKSAGEDAESGCSWTWEALESKEIKPPLKRANLLETPAMVALMKARKNKRGTTRMEDIFKVFEDFDRDEWEAREDEASEDEAREDEAREDDARELVPIAFTASPEVTPTTVTREVEVKLSPRLQLEPIKQSDSTAEKELPEVRKSVVGNLFGESEQTNEMENVDDPVLRVVTYDVVAANLELMRTEGKLDEFEQTFRQKARGFLHFDYKADVTTLTLSMVFVNHHYLGYYNSTVKPLLLQWYIILQKEYAHRLLPEIGMGDGEGVDRPRNETITWMNSPGGEEAFNKRGLELGGSGGEGRE